MASIQLDSVTVDFPVYSVHMRSLRNRLVSTGLGGRIAKHGKNRQPYVRALERVSLRINHGDRVGIVGPNGAGKTTLLRVLSGIYEPTKGHVYRHGRTASLLNVSQGMDPESTGYENIVMRGLFLGLTPKAARLQTDDIAEFTELGDYLAMPVYTYSSGMRLRLAFAICTSYEPDILLMDEWLSVGDKGFVDKAENRLQEFVHRAGIVVLASHNATLLQRICTKGVSLDAGRLRAVGAIGDVI